MNKEGKMRSFARVLGLSRAVAGVPIILISLFLQAPECSSRMVGGLEIKEGTWRGEDIEYPAGQILVKITSDADSAEVESLLAAHELSVRKCFDPYRWGIAQGDTSLDVFETIDSLMDSPLIECAEPNVVVYWARMPNDPHFQDSSQWSLWNAGKYGTVDADIDAPEAWNIDTGHVDLVVAVLDAGFAYVDTGTGPIYCHPDLSDTNKYFLGYACYDTCWIDYLGDTQFQGHGSPVTGIMAAMSNNDEGVAGLIWACKVYIMKIWGWGQDSIALASGVADAIDSSLSFGAQVINISGWAGAPIIKLEEAVSRANDSGCLIVATRTLVPARYSSWGLLEPTGYRNVIAVGTSNFYDHWELEGLSTDSFKITVVAPRYVVESTKFNFIAWERGEGHCTGYASFYGSSCSAPHVSGVAGLMVSHAMHQSRTSFKADSVRWFIERTADDIDAPGWDDSTGYGRLNAFRALRAMDGFYPNATGYVRTNTTWGDTLGDTLYVLGDVVIPHGCTLTIDQGAVVKFLTDKLEDWGGDSAKCEIIVQGKLIIDGEPDSLVQLMSCSDSPSDSDWYGIRLDSTGTIDLNYCVIQDASFPIPWDSPDGYTLNHVTFRHCRTWPSTVHSGDTVRVVGFTIEDFDTAMTVESYGALGVDSCEFDNGVMAIFVDLAASVRLNSCSIRNVDEGVRVRWGSASARFFDCEIRDASTGIYFNNAANDSVVGCTFRDNIVYGIYVPTNDNIFVDDCIFVDSTGSDTLIYGIYCSADMTITNSFFEGYEYGIKVQGKKGGGSVSPLIKDCGFYNLGKTGIWAAAGSDPTIKKCCFKGSFGKAGMEFNAGAPYIEQCYMASENEEILIGMLFTGMVSGKIRKTAIWDYDSCAVEIVGNFNNPDFGNSDSIGCNWFEEPGAGGYYFISSSLNTILAKSNYWDVDDGDTSGIRDKIVGNVDIHPILGKCDHCFPYYSEQCSELAPDDPTFEPCKIVAAGEDQKEREEEKQKGSAPREFALSQNYPNPFNPQTVIRYDLPEPVHIELAVYNALGQKVRTLVDEKQEEGYKTIIWHGKTDQGEEVASGIYFFKLRTGDFEQTKKMILLR